MKTTLRSSLVSAPAARRGFPAVLGALGLVPWMGVAQIVYTAESNSAVNNQSWQTGAMWTIAPSGGPSFPNNSPDASFNVTIPQSQTTFLTADVRVSSLTVVSGNVLTFQNGGTHAFIVEGPVDLQGSLTTTLPVNFVFNGATTLAGRMTLQDRTTILNNGTLVAGPTSSDFHFSLPDDFHSVLSDYEIINAGTAILNRPGGIDFRNFRMLNSGTSLIQTGTVRFGSLYDQNEGETRISNGAQLSSNNLNFKGGTVFAEGNALDGSNFSFGAARLEIGTLANTAAQLTITGNAGSFSGATFKFDLGGTSGGQFDQLQLPGGNFTGVTLDVGLVNGFGSTIQKSDTFTIITGRNFSGTFANQVGNLLTLPNGDTFGIDRQNGAVVLSDFTPVPEPGEFALVAGIGLLGFGVYRRLSRKA